VRFAYHFESGANGRGQILKLFSNNMKRCDLKDEFRLLTLGFSDKREFLPLQAADILAYEIYRHYPGLSYTEGDARYPIRQMARMPNRAWRYVDHSLLPHLNDRLMSKLAKS
jgi:hypothetical protein